MADATGSHAIEARATKVIKIEPLGRDSNNFVQLVHLATAPTPPERISVRPTQHGTKTLPLSSRQVVVRLSNRDAQLNDEARVENEVAAISTMQEALSSFPSKIVPQVYAWSSARAGHDGWMVQEYMPGTKIDFSSADVSAEHKRLVMDQAAQILHLLQTFDTGHLSFGGLRFGSGGRVCSRQLSLWPGGPFEQYVDMLVHVFRVQLDRSRNTPLVDGWRDTDMAERLRRSDETGGLYKLLSSLPKIRSTLVHGDLCLENILFDPDTFKVTALLDFDFTHIASPSDEFFYSFPDFHGIVPGPFEREDLLQLRKAQLNSFSNVGDQSRSNSADVSWEVAEMWQNSLRQQSAKGPGDLKGTDELSCIYWFLLDVCPPFFLRPRWLKRRTGEQQLAAKREVAENLDKYLQRWGY